ncbi:hypothetical protein WME79_45465 [Sorangium sp. So ce726]|uniref:pectate lyase family protein n=1 Tax=Sorangium sp. So ce726 TaxID=3133319 RepID=UPI003F617177
MATVATPLELIPAPGLAGPALKVDLDISGRSTNEVSEPGYVAWPITSGASASKTIDGVTFTFAKAGSNGTELSSTWTKVAVQAPNYARLVGDGITVTDGNSGSQIKLTIKGLSAGQHSLLAWHNVLGSSATAGKVSVQVDGTTKLSNLQQSTGALSTAAAASSYVTFTVQAGKDVVILYSSTASLVINGFELDTPNMAEQATSPTPFDGDEHADADSGSLELTWKASKQAVSHDVYVGADPNAVQTATHDSPEFQGNQSGTTFDVNDLSSIDRTYWRVDEVDARGGVTRGNVWYFRPRHLAFPGAEGYGRFAIGGRGGAVVHVTNLNDSGPGSLREAVEKDVGPRTIVFDVGGVIKLKGRLTLASRYVTIAGETAPGKGIVIRSAPFGFSGVSDGIMRFIRVRVGYGVTYDGIGLQGSDHCIFDHNSVSWSIDEAFSSRNAKNITLQRTMISEALNDADHQNYPSGTQHGYAGTISGNVGSFHHNLLAHTAGRNFSMGSAIDGANVFASRLDLFNNVVYNFRGRANDGQVHKANFVNNYYKKGPSTTIDFTFSMDLENYGIGTLQAYYAGNILQNANGSFRCDGTNNTCGRRYTLSNGNPEPTWTVFPTDGPLFPSYATIHSAKDAFKSVLSDVGANLPVFDDHDTRIVKETLNGTTTYKGSKTGYAGLPDREGDVGGLESYPNAQREADWDSDGDGLPDWWEASEGLDPSSPSGDFTDANTDLEGDGHTELEEYLAFMGSPHFLTAPGQRVSVDLGKLFAGFTNGPTYTSPSAENGAVTISGKTATFTPDDCGHAKFSVEVTDKDGSRMARDVLVFADGACD